MGLNKRRSFQERVSARRSRQLGEKERSGVCGAGAVVLLHFLLKNLDESGASEKNLIVSCCAFSQGDSLFA